LLAAAYRHPLHWTELIGGDVILTVTHRWQVRFNNSTIDPLPRIAIPVDPWIVTELLTHFPDFRRAYEPDGLTVAEFDNYGATVRTLRSFINAYHDLTGAIRDVVLPDPDIQPGN
jgi:transaldolase